uniref:Helicase ATP-binding domain-containing protein n=1 Tax=viral metagenome TaxID=1070528 RepID=A0A6C0EH62_9ZZZZ
MTNIILSKNGYFIPKNSKYNNIIIKAKKDLTVEPFAYFNKNNKINNFIVYDENDEYLIVPKYYGIKNFGLPDINHEVIGLPINILFKGNLRENQIDIIDKIIPYINKNDGGILCLPCAAGKTVLALYLACHYKVKTLIIVHKTFLLNQWKKRAQEFTNASIGIIKQSKIEINNDIVIGMLQSIAKDKYDKEIYKDFGMVIFDEAHHAPSKYFSKILPIIASKISLGLSATPKRTDKLEKILFWYFGDIMYQSDIKENNTVLVNIINYKIEHDKFKEFKLRNGDLNRPLTITKITTIGRRNKFIVNLIIKSIQENNNRKIIVLSDRIEHLKLLKLRLDDQKITTTDLYIGGMKQSALDIAEMANVIFASYAMAAEGLDIPNLNTLFMVTSRKEIEQAVGRIIRKIDPNIRPLIYDFTDCLPSFINQSRARKKFYNKMGFDINILDVDNNKIIKESLAINNCEFKLNNISNNELDENDFID